MILTYSHVSKIGIKRNRIADGFSNGIFENHKIMFAAFCFLHVNDLTAVPLYNNLRFYGVAFFLPE